MRVLLVLAVLVFVAHARGQSITQLVGGTARWASAQLDRDHGVLARAQQGRQSPEVTVSPAGGSLPARVTVRGTGYERGEKVAVRVHVTVLATVTADDRGAFRATVRIPADEFCPRHQCLIYGDGARSAKWSTAPFDVTN